MKPITDRSSGPDILLVDDDAVIRNLFGMILERAGYRVLTTADGRSGLKVMEFGAAPLVITDIVMEEMDGLELIRELKTKHPEVKIIAISGGGTFNAGECLHMADELGADMNLAKPICPAEFLSRVGELLPVPRKKDF